MISARELFSLNISSTGSIMLRVMLALVPGALVSAYFFGSGVLLNILWAVSTAVLFEALVLWMRKRNVSVSVKDGSIVLAAILLALALPPMMPFWQLSIGVVAMVFLGKHLFGGLGQNPFNPAMVGYAILLVSFPRSITIWPSPEVIASLSIPDLISIKLSGQAAAQTQILGWDAITQATPLDRLNSLGNSTPLSITSTSVIPWLWINTCFLLGGLYLLAVKTIRWHIPFSLLMAFALLTVLDSVLGNSSGTSFLVSLFSGAMMLGAFFIATDPVTAATSPVGRIIYGSGIGVLVFVLRKYSAYPEGIAFAVLVMNLCTPAIDALTLRSGKLQ